MTSTIAIRPARTEDVPDIWAMIRELGIYENLEHQITGEESKLREDLFGERPFIEALIGEWKGAPAGYALFFYNYSTFLTRPGLYLEDLYVRESARGAGLGKALLSGVAARAVERGAGRFEWSVLDWNEPSIEFYRRMGAEVLPDWRICRVTGANLKALARSESSG